jgi:hypothetical protein
VHQERDQQYVHRTFFDDYPHVDGHDDVHDDGQHSSTYYLPIDR